MWLRTLFLFLCAFSLTVSGPAPESKNGDIDYESQPMKYAFHTKIIDRAEHSDFAQGYITVQPMPSEKEMIGNLEVMWMIPQDYILKNEPFKITLDRGQVVDLKVSQDTDKWTIELIRALLSQMQISDLVEQRKDFSVMEESVTGKCETHYKFVGSNKIIKTKNYTNCEKVPMYERGVFGKDNWEAIMKKQDIINRTTTSEIKLDRRLDPQQIDTVERIEINSEKSSVVFQTITSLSSVNTDGIYSSPEDMDDLISVGRLMYQPQPQKKFCNKNRELSSNQIETSCETDYYMNPKYFSSLYEESAHVNTARVLVEQIAKELENHTEIPKTNTLDRFTVLVGVVRRMKVKELQELAELWEDKPNESIVYQQSLALAGTLDSLLTVKSIMKNRNWFYSVDITEMPNMVHPLTLEYLDTFFDFATDPVLMETAPETSQDLILDFTNLLRRYITEKEKPFQMEELNRLILKKYRKYFSSQLQDSLNKKDDYRFQIFTRAVGNMADLSLFNYILSLRSGKLSPFQKALVVNSMDKIVELYPAKARVMLVKLYNDEDEGLSVRIAAVYQLFKTDLPNEMVLDIIRVAKDSGDKDIQNAVKTTVMSHAYSYHLNEEISELAETITTNSIPETRKKEVLSEHKFQEKSDNITKTNTIIEMIKSMDENPFSVFVEKIVNRKGFKTQLKVGGMINNLDNFLRTLGTDQESQDESQEDSQESPSMRVYKRLQKLSKLSSGNFEVDEEFKQFFLPFEKLSGADLKFQQFLTSNQRMNGKELSMTEVEFGFPTEIGFPFLYSHQSPNYFFYDISTDVEETFTVNMHVIYSNRRQTKMGIINPIDGKYYVIGVDMNEHINVPITISYNSYGDSFVLSIDPLSQEGKQRILHLGSWPYVGERDIFPLGPTAEDENVMNVKPDDLVTAKEYLDDSDRFLVQATSSKINSTEQLIDYFSGGELDAYTYFGPFGEAFPTHNMFNIFFEEDVNAPTSLIFQLDLSNGDMILNHVTNSYGKMRGPFLFMGKKLFQASVELTGPTNRSVTLTLQQLQDFMSNTLRFSLAGSYSENKTTVYQGCYDTVITQKPSKPFAEDNNKVYIYIQMKGGKTCAEGGMISFETEVDVEKMEKTSTIDAELMVDFKDLPDEIAVAVCGLSEDDTKYDNVNLKFVQKNEDECKELTRNENNENAEEVDETVTEKFERVAPVEAMWLTKAGAGYLGI